MNTFRQKTILVVEDEALLRFSIADALEDAGYAVLEASTVLEAVGKLGQYEEIDVVLTDVDMPGALNGMDLARMVAECAPHIGIIVSSARRACDLADLPPAAHCLPKPFTPVGLLSLVGRVSSAKAAEAEKLAASRRSA